MIDSIIILGKQLHKNGNIDSILRDRVKKGVEISKLNPSAKIILSGARPHWNKDISQKTEAFVMREYLKEIYPEVDEKRIVIEESGNSTIDQFIKIKTEILIPMGFKDIALVTDEVHIKRAGITLKHILGDKFNVTEFPSVLDIAGGWRTLIEERENNAYQLTLNTRINVINRGDHETWRKLEDEFQNKVKSNINAGMSVGQTMKKLIDDNPEKE